MHRVVAIDSSQEIAVTDPILWDIDNPQLYTVYVQVREGEEIRDQLSTTFGIRTAEMVADKGFFLNGDRVELRGV